jgi:hypothetical protein
VTGADPTTLDYIAAYGTAIGALAAAAAVIVALFGPSWRTKRREPQLTLEPENRGLEVPTAVVSAYPMRLRLRNERGRDTAQDVEVFVTAVTPLQDGSTFQCAEDSNLSCDPPSAGEREGLPRTVATVPSGHTRAVYFVLMGNTDSIAEKLGLDRPAYRAYAALVVPVRTSVLWLQAGHTWDITLVITGANFNAVTYQGKVQTTLRADRFACVWTEGPKQVHKAKWSERSNDR